MCSTPCTALGTRYHLHRRPAHRATLEAALQEAGLPVDPADSGDADRWDHEPRASRGRGLTLVGQNAGSPITTVPVPDFAAGLIVFFGPVVSPSHKGEDAGRLRARHLRRL
ncbi:hypothetical protein [Streptomyces sp. NPDC059479]|uniref:mycothiol-dependent nitroreductase Rv2466c family protein n=1 Tax=Streptomyces sp. NPDC059479 TaxID=3346848 RepID=UPI003673AB02